MIYGKLPALICVMFLITRFDIFCISNRELVHVETASYKECDFFHITSKLIHTEKPVNQRREFLLVVQN